MAIKPITTFEGDPWKKQKEESDRAHHYFKQYKKKNLSKKKFKQLLLEEADERSVKGQVKFWGPDTTFNKKNQKEIQLFIDTHGKKGQCPKPCGTIEDWFDFHKWFVRKQDYDSFKDEEADLLIRAMITEEKPQIAADIIENIKLTTKKRKEQKQSGQGTLSQDEAGAKSINTDINSLKTLSNDDATKIDANLNADVTADVKTQTTAEIKTEKLKELREKMEQMTYD